MKTITRKTMLYKSQVDFGDYALNHVLGCSHGCRYPCYALLMKKRFGQIKSNQQWTEPVLVSNTLELLDQEITRLKKKINSVHLCFTTDPFMYRQSEVIEMSLAVIQKLNENGIRCRILTKGVLPASLADRSKDNEYGITLVSLDESFREKYEPGAACLKERLEALKALHEAGCKTWISMEPYPTPNIIDQNLEELLEAVSFVDKIVFGRWNYSREVTAYKEHKEFYTHCARKVIDFCNGKGIEVIIKNKTITSAEERIKASAMRKV